MKLIADRHVSVGSANSTNNIPKLLLILQLLEPIFIFFWSPSTPAPSTPIKNGLRACALKFQERSSHAYREKKILN